MIYTKNQDQLSALRHSLAYVIVMLKQWIRNGKTSRHGNVNNNDMITKPWSIVFN